MGDAIRRPLRPPSRACDQVPDALFGSIEVFYNRHRPAEWLVPSDCGSRVPIAVQQGPDDMFLDLGEFTFVKDLESAWLAIRAEYDALSPDDFIAWPESELYDFGWKAFGLIALGQPLVANCNRCPRTVAAIAGIPGITTAGFSLLAAGAKIRPHCGYTSSVYRLHLGIKVPSDCGLTVAGETRAWTEGKVLAFDDTAEHSAWNNSDADRAVLLLDVLRPGAEFEVTPAALQAVEAYLRVAK